jgi:hypothetical protein
MPERPRWAVSALAIGIGIVYLTTWTIGGSFTSGLIMLGVMVAYAVFLLIGERAMSFRCYEDSPLTNGTSTSRRETVVVANVIAVFVVALAVIEFARGRDGIPYTLIAFVFAVTYVLPLIWLRRE